MHKFLFPFYNKERQKKLNDKWWFRLFIVLFFIALVSFPVLWFNYEHNWGDTCYERVASMSWIERFSDEEKDALEYCFEYRESMIPYSIISTVVSTIVAYYLVQFIFFKVVIDYIYLGKKSLNTE